MEASVYISGRTLARVEEVMTDLLLCELIGVEPELIGDIAVHLGMLDHVAVRSVCRSVHESALGETDIEILIDGQGSTTGLLIENKIRAIRMERQFERYRLRGQEGIDKGRWQAFKVVLAAPQSYIASLTKEEAASIDGTLPYEWLVSWLRSQDARRHAFKIHAFEEALRDARVGYQKKQDSRMTAFHHGVYRIVSADYPELRMRWIEFAGYDDSIIHLPDALPARGDKLLLKAKMGTAEMRIASYDPVETKRVLSLGAAAVDPLWRATIAKGYAGLEVPVERIDPTREFSENEVVVRKYLDALRALKLFYHREDIERAIFASRGSR